MKMSCPHPFRLAALLAALWLIAGCAGRPVQGVPGPARFLHDEAFPGAASVTIESRQEVFTLDARARRYLDEKIGHLREPSVRSKFLVNEIIQQSARKLSYDSGANTTASDTFHNQTANCLSMSIMTYAMAEYLGFDTTFQLVEIPEYWERRGEHSLVARHVNLLLKPASKPGGLSLSDTIEIDFFAPGSSRRFGSHTIPVSTVLAMFYNNKGVDALFAGNDASAYAYLRAALTEDPSLNMAVGNLALLYAANGHMSWAEKNYREAARRNPDDTVSAEGLAMVLELTGRHEEAESIRERLARERRDNPYYHYVLGEEAYDAGNWDAAIRAFNKAIDLGPEIDQPYFGLAKTWYQLGDNDKAAAYLRRAERHADREETKRRYRSKISLLSDL